MISLLAIRLLSSKTRSKTLMFSIKACNIVESLHLGWDILHTMQTQGLVHGVESLSRFKVQLLYADSALWGIE